MRVLTFRRVVQLIAKNVQCSDYFAGCRELFVQATRSLYEVMHVTCG
jgi:hypothetical protein